MKSSDLIVSTHSKTWNDFLVLEGRPVLSNPACKVWIFTNFFVGSDCCAVWLLDQVGAIVLFVLFLSNVFILFLQSPLGLHMDSCKDFELAVLHQHKYCNRFSGPHMLVRLSLFVLLMEQDKSMGGWIKYVFSPL